ncbi:MAG TPA: hypothetical protein PLP27_11980 [Crocinitomicaceae bacterium]|nr:hypothetical protein [Crocinitomicaceae bacterium]
MKFFRNLYFTNRFFYALLGLATLFILAFFFHGLMLVSKILLFVFICILL